MRLQKSPLGLLELFRLRQLGQNPTEFAAQVTPVADVTDYYGTDLVVSADFAGAAGAIDATMLTPASDFPRRLLSVAGFMTIGAAAGTWFSIAIGYRVPASATATVFIAEKHVIAPVAASTILVAWSSTPLLLPAGHQLVLRTFGDAAGADHAGGLRLGWHRLDGQ